MAGLSLLLVGNTRLPLLTVVVVGSCSLLVVRCLRDVCCLLCVVGGSCVLFEVCCCWVWLIFGVVCFLYAFRFVLRVVWLFRVVVCCGLLFVVCGLLIVFVVVLVF